MAHTIGSIVRALGVVVGLVIFHRLLANYRITGRTESLFLAGFWGCLGVAVLLVGLEQAVLGIMDRNDAKNVATLFAVSAFSFAILQIFRHIEMELIIIVLFYSNRYSDS